MEYWRNNRTGVYYTKHKDQPVWKITKSGLIPKEVRLKLLRQSKPKLYTRVNDG